MPESLPRSRAGAWLARFVRALVEQGITPGVDESLAKRIRLTNGLSLFGALVLFASAPFDRLEAPRWVVVEDLLGGVAYVCFPLLNRLGYRVGSRLLCLLVSNLIVLGNDVLLGHDSGAELIFVALAAVPFALFDLAEPAALIAGVAFALPRVRDRAFARGARLVRGAARFLAGHYYVYSAGVSFLVLIYTMYRLSRANTDAERALRDDVRERLRAQRELELSRQTAAYSAKMAALGEMSSNVAHEVNNPLAAILLRAHRLRQLVSRAPLDLQAVARVSGDIEATVHRIHRIVDALRTFARDAEHDPLRPEPVARIVADTVELCNERFRHHAIELRVDPIPAELVRELPWHPDLADPSEPAGERLRRHRNPERAVGADPDGERRRRRAHLGPGQRAGCAARPGEPDHGAVLHDQGGRQGHGPGAQRIEGDRGGARRAADPGPRPRWTPASC